MVKIKRAVELFIIIEDHLSITKMVRNLTISFKIQEVLDQTWVRSYLLLPDLGLSIKGQSKEEDW